MSELYGLVEHYAALGDHRTGTKVDAATTNWLADLLAKAGAQIARQPYDFDMFSAELRGTGSAQGVRLEPLFYSAVGHHSESAAFVTSIAFDEFHGDHAIAQQLAEITRLTRAAGSAIALVATLSPSGGVCAINRAPAAPGAVPVCLVPGEALQQLSAAPAGVEFDAKIASGHSENLSALFACEASSRPPLVVTTPISGWFSCAGERGTGIAVAVSVAQELCKQVPVLLVMTTGHELGYHGAAKFVEAFDRPISGVLHLGSCIADKTALGTGAMWSVTSLKGAALAQVRKSLASLNVEPEQPQNPTQASAWIGESELWAPRGHPMISIAGASETFHTPDDLAANVTSPELLERVRSCVLQAAQALIA